MDDGSSAASNWRRSAVRSGAALFSLVFDSLDFLRRIFGGASRPDDVAANELATHD